MLKLIKNSTFQNLLNFVKKFDIEYIKNDIELSNISKSFLKDYDIIIDLDIYNSTKEFIEYVEEVITYYQDSQTIYQYYEKDMFTDKFEVLDDEWTKICYHVNKYVTSDDTIQENILNFLEDKEFRDE